MLFNSIPFLVFLPAFLAAYFATRGAARLAVCLAGSYLFYGWWDWRFLGLIALSTGIDYVVGLKIAGAEAQPAKRRWLMLSLTSNLGLLAVFKYFNFFLDSVWRATGFFGFSESPAFLAVILPVGISFYTFQTLSYSIDLYRGTIEVERNLLRFATYVAFFPQLVAGPIVRASLLLPQLRRDHPFLWSGFLLGLGQVLLGYVKKVAIADSLAPFVDRVFDAPEAFTPISVVIGVFFYAFQIYCDFSGYSDIAIGLARMLGYDFGVNFDTPYFSRSFSEFWTRWHISLSSWLRDYLYIPLGGNRGGTLFTYRNLVITMLLGGLWHGASWNFVLWGALHGLYLVLQRLIGPSYGRLVERLRIPRVVSDGLSLVVVFALTCFAWIFFRSPTWATSMDILQQIASLDRLAFADVQLKVVVLKGFLLIGMLVTAEAWSKTVVVPSAVLDRPVARTLAYAAALWLIVLFGTFDGGQFIYFQF
ncbi:MBOAT family O-acyltransferase [Rubrivirga sp.]|uniref:MBOAT family O-acyltransferase n=1 Tax=Rubrivirga sp. TaxID=1885344 RepID=UPI003B5302D5